MAIFEFDARINTTISVSAEAKRKAAALAVEALERISVQDPQNPDFEFRLDTEDGVEPLESDGGVHEFDARLNLVIRTQAETESAAEKLASKVFERLILIDGEDPGVSLAADKSDGIELMGEELVPEDLQEDEPVFSM